jgi:tRNA-binding EMAP/Myf-like protein
VVDAKSAELLAFVAEATVYVGGSEGMILSGKNLGTNGVGPNIEDE